MIFTYLHSLCIFIYFDVTLLQPIGLLCYICVYIGADVKRHSVVSHDVQHLNLADCQPYWYIKAP